MQKTKKQESMADEFDIFGINSFTGNMIKKTLGAFIIPASGTYSNGGFTLKPDRVVEKKYLGPVSEDMDDIISKVKISDMSANMATVKIIAYDNLAHEAGEFSYMYSKSLNEEECKMSLVYTDRNVSITGSYTEENDDASYTATYDVFLKKGWNKVYLTEIHSNGKDSFKATSEEPEGLKWHGSIYRINN